MPDILIIDDEYQIRKMLKLLLEDEGYEVHEASNGKEGIKLVRQHLPSLAIVDIFMPEKEGLETIQELRRDYPELKIIAISGGSKQGIIGFLECAERFGADKTLSKPFEPPHLISMIEELLAV